MGPIVTLEFVMSEKKMGTIGKTDRRTGRLTDISTLYHGLETVILKLPLRVSHDIVNMFFFAMKSLICQPFYK